MPPTLALVVTTIVVVWLFRRDFRQEIQVSRAMWLPQIWMLITFTRAVSEWLSMAGFHVGAVSVEDGSPLDAAVYLALIIGGLLVLNKRHVRLAEVAQNNRWLIIFLVFGLISVAWSDFPYIAFKRWIKILGHPVMAFVILTESDPRAALKRLLKRTAYIVIPYSILTIKYYPTIGRTASPWATASMNKGIARGKNQLGCDCFILALFYYWCLVQIWRTEKGKTRRKQLLGTGFFLCLILWLEKTAHSSTALASLFLGIATMTFLGFRFVNKRAITAYLVTAVLVLGSAQLLFGISDLVLAALQRDSTLTGRTEVWAKLLSFHTNPIVGVGFESFWLGDRLKAIGELYWWQANEAHNGYLETYLNLGGIGVFIMVAWMFSAYQKSRAELLRDFEYGRFRMGFLAAMVAYNLAESGFRTLHPLWFMFYIIALDYPRPRWRREAGRDQVSELPEREPELVAAHSL
jgi:exopolysaccharide production protein ExoQ